MVFYAREEFECDVVVKQKGQISVAAYEFNNNNEILRGDKNA